jgi:uncharacterized protein YceH (UPF0502 family)
MADTKSLRDAIDALGARADVMAAVPTSAWPAFRRVGAELIAWAESVERESEETREELTGRITDLEGEVAELKERLDNNDE